MAAPDAGPADLVAGYVATIRQAVHEYGDIAELIQETARVDANVAQTAELGRQAFRRELREVAARVCAAGASNAEIEDAVDVLAYYLDFPSWRRLTLDLGWSLDKAQAWLSDRIIECLIAPRAR